MKPSAKDLPLFAHLVPAALIGALAYRACMTGRGFGNSEGTAWLAAFGTGFIAFVVLLIIIEPWPLPTKFAISIGSTVAVALIHIFGF